VNFLFLRDLPDPGRYVLFEFLFSMIVCVICVPSLGRRKSNLQVSNERFCVHDSSTYLE
jgi:hypothetical protein